jgi:hypothetical protein
MTEVQDIKSIEKDYINDILKRKLKLDKFINSVIFENFITILVIIYLLIIITFYLL